MSNQPYDLQQLWDKTNNGLTFFEDEFSGKLGGKKGMKGFSARSDDDTGSAHISVSKSTKLYLFTDFGVYNKGVNAIEYVKIRDNADFLEACKTLFNQYGLAKNEFQKIEPITKFSSEVTKKDGFWKVDFFSKIQDANFLKNIIPFYTDELLKEYDFKQIKSYENVGKKKTNGELYHRSITATAEFPIYGYDKKDFIKLYQPVAPKGDKYLLKHGFVGVKPERIVYGLDRLLNEVDVEELDRLYHRLRTEKNIQNFVCGDDWSIEDTSDKKTLDVVTQINQIKLDEVFIATGGSDGLNLASMGYNVIWFNSESEIINSKEYHLLNKIAKKIYYVPDLDQTGVNQAAEMGLKFLKIKMVWLPESLKDSNKKDFSDWLRLHKTLPVEQVKAMFEQIKSIAIEFKFWDSDDKTVRINQKKMKFFLYHNHFRQYKQPFVVQNNGKEPDGLFVKIDDGIVKQVYPTDVKNWTTNWIDSKYLPISVYNMIEKSTYFNGINLKSLPTVEIKKKQCGADYQYYFFKNCPVMVTPEKIEKLDYKALKKLNISTWEDRIIDHKLELQPNKFEVSTDDSKRKRIKILDNSSNYFKVLINTSRIFWKKDGDINQVDLNPFGINSKKLTDDENYLQELHLLNKMYCVGYLLHQDKKLSKAKMVLGMDYQGGKSIKTSKGGTGKSFLQESLRCMLNTKIINGESLNSLKNSFPLNGITPKTDFVCFDDLSAYQSMRYFYTFITSNFEANQKGGVIYDLPFSDSPKIGGTTNFAPNDIDESTLRRLNIYYNSDFYHKATSENEYEFSRSIKDDFKGKDIMSGDYPAEEWNNDFNFLLQCLHFYLGCTEEIEAPIDVLVERNRWQKIGDVLKKFLDGYFSDNEHLNTWVEKSKVGKTFIEDLGGKTKQQVNDALYEYCAAMGWSYEEKKLKNTVSNSVMHFYINTSNNPADETKQEAEKELQQKADEFATIDKITNDIPF